MACRYLFELLYGTVPVHLQVDTDTAIHGTHGHVYVDVRYTGFDDLVQDLPRLLVICNSYADIFAPFPETVAHATGDLPLEVCWQVEEAVNFAAVLVVDLDAIRAIGCSRIRLNDHLVKKVVEILVLCLGHATSERNATSIVNHTLGINEPIHTLIGVLVDEGA